MEHPGDCELRTPILGRERGAFSDWLTQRWVQLTGRRIALADHPWLDGQVGEPDRIGADFFRRWAMTRDLEPVVGGPRIGLIDDFARLHGPLCRPEQVDPRVAEFYEDTARYDFDVWSEWCGAFRPFGSALAAIFSRRLQQLNVPLSSLDTSLGITSEVLRFKDRSGRVVCTAWVRELVSTKRTLYAGSYTTCRVPGYDGPCVRIVFPLPNGSATVVMRPESAPDGSFTLRSTGVRFGDPGFYFYVQEAPGGGWARQVRTFQETIRVYVDETGTLRADHEFRIWRVRFLRLHYRMRFRASV